MLMHVPESAGDAEIEVELYDDDDDDHYDGDDNNYDHHDNT